MLIGLQCHKQENITDGMMQDAIAHLRNFVFVGVSDRYDESVEAFHIMMQKGTKPSPIEFEKHRAGSYNSEALQVMNDILDEIGFYDPYDEEIYKIANEMFNETLVDIKSGKYSSRKRHLRGLNTINDAAHFVLFDF
jgi:hypothetical protein